MLHTIPVQPSVTVTHSPLTADQLLTALGASIPSTAVKLYRLLHETTMHALGSLGHTLLPNQFIIHQPVEVMARAVGVSRVTLYKHLKTLRRLGLIDTRAHKGNWYGLTRSTGTLFAVSLKPGHSARLRWFDLKHKYRDLQADTESGTRTAWKFLQGLQSLPSAKEACRTALKAWAVKPGTTLKPVNNDCKPATADYVYALDLLPDTHPRRRAESVDRYAKALAAGYGDQTNLNFWRWLLWRSIEADQMGQNTLYQLQNALTRLRADIDEWKGLKSPGALLVHRLKEAGVWDVLRCTQPLT